jgi:glucose-1-phosphate thymidylyltransferase
VKEDILVIAGDNLFSFQLDDFLKYYESRKSPVTALYDVGDYELAKRYGVVEIDRERILRFYEKPEKPPSILVGIGIYAFPYETVKMLAEYVEDNERHDNLGDFLSWLCSNMKVYGFPFSDRWYDVGNPDSYIEALKFYMEHHIGDAKIDGPVKIIEPVVVKDGAVIKGRSIIGPFAYIGRDCVIENSDVSDSVIFDRVILKKAKVWKSVIDEDCEIWNLELSNSIIGGHAKIQRG